MYDENKVLVSSVILTANTGEVAIRGLQSGKTYYVVEEDWEYYTIEGYSVFETQLQGRRAIGLQVAQLPEGTTGIVRVQVNNSTLDETLIPDDLVPLAPGVPAGTEVVEIEAEQIPLSGNLSVTGDAFAGSLSIVIALAAFVGTVVLVRTRKKKS